MAIRRSIALAVIALFAASAAAMAADEEEEVMSLYQPRDPCPQVERIVKQAVDEEFKKNNQITAGFLRVFFHDCFSRGCDASILLDGEWDAGVNRNSVHPRVRQLMNEIRVKVNKQCGDQAVSCADILAIATRDAVAAAKGPNVTTIPRGRFDSLTPQDISKLPSPLAKINDLLTLFTQFGLNDPADLVALSGGHTVGKTTRACGVARPDFRDTCNQNGQQVLDVITPNEFDNQYFVALTRNKGVFSSDQDLLNHTRTSALVRSFANDKQAFFRQWATSITKLSRTNWLTPSNGQIRRDCTKPNSKRLLISNVIDADLGFPASA
ncbi:hypothetical protein PR202_ga18490 [Eleusine coracana subsp. coracana]|uniref:Peroxidase n=1 Tax=Eleusine coracana subsp. coracana TaxID=191504 RepID=A0AAV5CS56_ELECO|nr:hypothetical protein QOZ80_4AG0298460 [Eleusine coracana subsp. coracana]GJN01239.1 hypothetical protein PR202_ga18490 [Eleusine coracana subsp. coracana]